MRFVFLGDHPAGRWDGEANDAARGRIEAGLREAQGRSVEVGCQILE